MIRRIGIGILLLAAAAAWAATPEGAGNVALGMGYSPGQTLLSGGTGGGGDHPLSYKSQDSWVESFSADVPVWSGLSAGLEFASREQAYGFRVDAGALGFNKIDEDLKSYHLGLELNAYPAAFVGKPYRPGGDANADGWLYWPSLRLTYALDRANEFSEETDRSFGVTTAMGINYFQTNQSFSLGLVLPVATWMSVSGGFQRNTENYLTVSLPNATFSMQTGGIQEGESADVIIYVDWAKAAGEVDTRPFVPHLGRLGQLKVDLGWTRSLNLEWPPVTGSQSYAITLAAPVTANLGLCLAVSQTEQDALVGGFRTGTVGAVAVTNRAEDRDTMAYTLSASWAFGSPERRVDR